MPALGFCVLKLGTTRCGCGEVERPFWTPFGRGGTAGGEPFGELGRDLLEFRRRPTDCERGFIGLGAGSSGTGGGGGTPLSGTGQFGGNCPSCATS